MPMGGSPSPPSTPKPPRITDPEIERAKMMERRLLQQRRGFSSTILTGGQGVLGPAVVNRPGIKQTTGA